MFIDKPHHTGKRLLVWALLILQVMPLSVRAAPTIPDTRFPGEQPIITPGEQSIITPGASKVPIIQIAPPNDAKVSHNRFLYYNVDPQGQILNNSGLPSKTILAGEITGNPMLGNNHATLILNEVTSAIPSWLRGPIEIAGHRADLVIANPGGIRINGASFINVGGATLTTGTPAVGADGRLNVLDIQRGLIDIQGQTFDALGADSLRLISRSLLLNAKLQANDLEVVAGANRIDVASGAITPQSGSGVVPRLAVDIGVLGGMHAQRIYLVGTEAGVGVNSQGKLEAQIGDIILSSAGDLAIDGGKLEAAWDVRADAGRDLTLKAADIQAGGDIDLAAGRNLIIGAKRVDAAATRVAGNTTNTVETVEHIGSVLEAGGDLYLTASLDPTLAVSSDTLATWQSARSTAEQDLAGKAELAGTLKTQAEIAQADIDTSSLVELESRLNGLQYNWDSGWYCREAWYNQDCVSPWEYPALQERASAERARLAPKQALVATWKAAEAAVTQSQANLDAILSQQEAFKGGRIDIDASGLVAGGNLSASASEIALQGRNDSKLVRDVSVSHHRSCNGFLGLSCKNWTETTTLESYDETLKPGELDAVGDIALFAQGNRDTNAAYIPETGNVLLLGAAVRSDLGQVSLGAANDLEIEAAQLRHAHLKEVRTRIVDSWLFAPVSTTTRLAIDSEESDLSQGSLVTGDSLQLQAGRDLLGRGAALSADHDIQLIAGRDLDLLEARDQVSREMIRESKKAGLFKTGLIGLTLGTTSTRHAREEAIDTAVSTQVASIDGNLGLLAGRDLSVQGTDLLAGGDIDLIGDNVAILAAANVYDRKDSVQTRTSGLTLALKGGIVDVVEAAWQAGRRAEETSDGRLKAAYAAKAGYHLYRAYDMAGQLADFGTSLEGLGQGFNELLNGNREANADSGGINLELTIGGSASSSENRLHEVTYGASHLDSGGDTTVVARAGVEGGGNLAIVGSQLTAHDLTLSAGNDLTLRHAQQTRTASEQSSNTAAAVGIGFGTDGLYFTVSGQVGNAKGEALKEDNGETRLHADNRLTLLSGGDALLKGVIANAQRIEADIGGDLTLQSLQDSERYRYKSSNAGGSLQIGYGKFNASVNAGQQNIRNDYQSVIEQTGLFAGDGGYDIQVGGHTQLDGAAIAGGEASLNRLGTQSIGYSDLTNHEQTTVSGYSFGLGTGAGSNYVSPVANLNSNRASVTQAVIGPGTVEVRDLAGKDREQLEADSASRQSRIASLQSDVERLKAQKAQQELGNTWLLPWWRTLLAYAKANPTTPWWGGTTIGNIISQLEGLIASAETDPATFQARIDQANGQIADSQAALALTDGLIGEFQAIDTLTGRDLATANPALASRFDANRTRAHLEAMTVFSETAMRVVGDVYKPLTDAVAQAEAGLRQAQKSGDGTAIQAATARLAGAREALDAKSGERALAHGLVGGLTAALGGVDPATGFLGGAAGKLASTELGKLIDGSDWARSNPVAAELLKTAIATSAGMVAGGATGGMVASQGDRFNRQLHTAEIAFIQKRAAAYARQKGTTVAEAERLLARGALYANDADWQAAYSLYSADEVAAYQTAAAWLQDQARLDNFTFINEQGQKQIAFTASKAQFYDETVFLRNTLADSGNRDFYAGRAAVAVREMSLGNGLKFTAKGVAGFGQEVPKGMAEALRGYAALLDAATYAKLAKAAQTLAADPKGTLDKLVTTAKGAGQDAVLGIYIDWLQKDSKELGQRAGYVTGQTLVDAAALAMGLGIAKNGGTVLDKAASLTDGFKARISAAPAWTPGYMLNPLEANRLVRDSLPDGVHGRPESAMSLNSSRKPGYDPSYLPGTTAYTYTAPKEGEKFVRVYVDGVNDQANTWVARAQDVAGLSPEQIKDKFALTRVPTYITDVSVPAGTEIRASVANGILGNRGGGVQFEIVKRPAVDQVFENWFTNARPLK